MHPKWATYSYQLIPAKIRNGLTDKAKAKASAAIRYTEEPYYSGWKLAQSEVVNKFQ